MPVELKNTLIGGLDLDTSYYLVQKNRYVDALNITKDAAASGQDLATTNIIANRLVTYSLPAGTNKVIGKYPNTLRNTAIYMVYNSNGNHCVFEYDDTTRTITKIFENLTDSASVDILGFTDTKITEIDIYNRDEGDLLFFLDTIGRPTTMNITTFKAGTYTPVTRDIIDVCKRPPLSPPTSVYANDAARTVNNLRNKLFKFTYLWVYDDNEDSCCGPESSVPLPLNILDPVFTNVATNNNLITLSLNSGPKNVKSVKLLMSYVEKTNNWSDFLLVDTINKADGSISDDVAFPYSFYNDSTYPVYNVVRRIQLFDYVPDYAKAQGLANGNVAVYGAITEGIDRDLSPNVVITVSTIAAGNGGTVGSLSVTSATSILSHLTFTGIPATGTVVTTTAIRTSDGAVITFGTYTTVAGDTSTSVATGLAASMVSIGIVSVVSAVGNVVNFFFGAGTYHGLLTTITAPAPSLSANSLATWKWSTERRMGIVYFDQKGKTNGVLYDAKVSFPNYTENGSHIPLVPYVNVKIYHVPPDWAYSYQLVFTKEGTKYLYWHTVDVNTTETDYLYFDISNITLNALKTPTVASVLNWGFSDGDRMRLIRRMSDGFIYGPSFDTAVEGIVVDPKINNVLQTGKTFIKIRKAGVFATELYTSKYFVVELYRPGQPIPNQNNEVFYEFGDQFAILNPTTGTRVHAGQVTDQSTDYVTPAEINIYNGDSYLRQRSVYLTETGVGTFNVADRNFVDFYTSAVSSIDGRPSEIDIDQKQTYFPAMIRFGQAIQPNTNINGLNRFVFEDFVDCDYSYGDIGKLVMRDREMRVFQMYKIGAIPLFSQIQKDPAGNNVIVTTDKLLNPIRYYSGNYGIGTLASSVVSYNFADYFASNVRGIIGRVSNDGVKPISVLYKVNSWASDQLPLRGLNECSAAYDPKSNNYILCLDAVDGADAVTISFGEEANTFESFLSFHPDNIVALGTTLISFKDGEVWTHDSDGYNNFYGVAYESSITPVFNEATAVKKTFLAIAYQSNQYWASPSNGDIITSMINPQTNLQQISQLKTVDYETMENVRYAAFLRDANSSAVPTVAVLEGDVLKGVWVKVKLICPSTSASELVYLIDPYILWQPSPKNF